jgi:DtxR family manganese transport transcriptional regulator
MSPNERTLHFKQVRSNRLYEIVEDYTELISDLTESQGNARVCDIAKMLGISHVTVLKTIKKLIKEGYVIKILNKHIELTAKGKEKAAFSKKKHQALLSFLLKLGVPEHIAAVDVEGIEHYISPDTLNALLAHMQNMNFTQTT